MKIFKKINCMICNKLFRPTGACQKKCSSVKCLREYAKRRLRACIDKNPKKYRDYEKWHYEYYYKQEEPVYIKRPCIGIKCRGKIRRIKKGEFTCLNCQQIVRTQNDVYSDSIVISMKGRK